MLVVNRTSLIEARAAVRAAGFSRLETITWLNGVQLGGDPSLWRKGKRPPPRRDKVVVGLLPGARLRPQREVRAAPVHAATPGRYPAEKPEHLGEALARIAGERRGDLVVDPYCGSGALLVGPRRRGASVVGVDSSSRAIAIARRRLA